MKSFLLVIFIWVLSSALSRAGTDNEEFYIVTEGPVAVGGGMVRHYSSSPDDERIATRYSFGGMERDNLLVKKTSRMNGAVSSETLFLPLKSNRRCLMNIGSHKIELKLNDKGHILIKETR